MAMKLQPFKLERYFARYEFSAPYLLCCSDCEPFTLKELLLLADEQTLELWEKLRLGYTEPLGHPLLREEVASLYKTIHPENVLVTTPEEGIFIAMNVILEKHDHVVTTFPGYQSLYEIANGLGCEVTKWIPREANQWNFDIDDLKSGIKKNTKLIVINFPHNPTGSLIGKEKMGQILELARERSIFVFSDEMYRYLEYNQQDRLDSASDLYENAISLSGLSKSFALAGLRVGWLTTKQTDLLGKFASFKDYTTICGSAPSELLALMALRAKDKILARNLEIIQRNLVLLDDFFKKYSTWFSWTRPKGGPIAFPKLLDSQDVSAFCFDLVEEKGVMLLPAGIFDYEGNHFRVGFGRSNMPEALTKVGEWMNEKGI
jgi:aspartate/methionine/tyrosine aminotransferase